MSTTCSLTTYAINTWCTTFATITTCCMGTSITSNLFSNSYTYSYTISNPVAYTIADATSNSIPFTYSNFNTIVTAGIVAIGLCLDYERQWERIDYPCARSASVQDRQ